MSSGEGQQAERYGRWMHRGAVVRTQGEPTMIRRTVVTCGIVAMILGAVNRLEAAPRIDFDGDGFADLAVGVPHEDVGAAVDAGAINVLYGSADGLTEVRSQFFTQGTRRVPGWVQAGAQFGKALAAGDFNGDGFTGFWPSGPRGSPCRSCRTAGSS